jgi:hypothetical protein
MARRSKAKAEAETRLPPLTTEQNAGTDWHKKKTGERPAPMWSVSWDTSRHPGSGNAAYQKTGQEAAECARRFLKMGFIVYSIKDPAGTEMMDEATIANRLGPTTY